MTPERWHQISRIFNSAISLDGAARAAYVADKCGSDQSLRAEVEKLIESHQHASEEKFIGGAAVEDGAVLLVHETERHESALAKGQQLGSYVVLDALGAGGMGEVYLARDSRLDRTVALKVLAPDVSADKRRMQRFRQEAKVASSLNQPNILTIFEFGDVDGLTFLATEYIDGETLRSYLRGKRLKLLEILDITSQIVAALDAAHEARIVHRDMKPENVMIRRRDRVVKVLDFGLAKVTEKKSGTHTHQQSDLEAATEFKTAPGSLMGTLNYMSPEQAQMHDVDERTDIWSTGVMIYEMVAGEMPFKGATSAHTVVQILEKEPAPLTQVSEVKVPAELQRIVNKAMAKSPDERYQTAKDLLIDLRSLKRKLDVDAEIERSSSPAREKLGVAAGDRKAKTKRVLAFALTGMVVVTAAIFGLNIWRSSRATTVAPASAAPPIVAEERSLNYSITIQKFRDNKPFKVPSTIAGETIFEEGYQIRLNLRSPQDGHLYVLNQGPAKTDPPEFVVVIPSAASYGGSTSLRAGKEMQVPENSWLKFDSEQGVETLWLIFSSSEIPELERLRVHGNSRTGGTMGDDAEREIQKFLKEHESLNPSYEKGETESTLKIPGKLLIYPVRLEHH